MEYEVTFTKYYVYEVTAESEEEAFDSAYEDFVSDMRRPIANIFYDDVEVEEVGE